MKQLDIIQRNMFCRLRTEAFHTGEQEEPMSPYKKRRLERMFQAVNAASTGKVTFTNPLMANRLRKIINQESKQTEQSSCTLEVLKLIVANINVTLNRGIPVNGIIKLGMFIREHNNDIDFDRLSHWLSLLHASSMAQLQGNILITFFKFKPEEVPFVHYLNKGATKLMLKSLRDTGMDTEKEWHFKQLSSGFVTNNTTILRRNLTRSMRYFGYMPFETICNFVHNFIRSLSEIEE